MGWSFRRSSLLSTFAAAALVACGLDVVGASATIPDERRDASGLDRDAGPSDEDAGPGPTDGGDEAEPPAPTSKISIAVTDLGNVARTIDLTSEGTLDWVYFAHDGVLGKDVYKSGVKPLIASPYGWKGTNATRGTESAIWPVTQTWTDGSSPASGSSRWNTYFLGTGDTSVTMNVQAATTERTFTLIAGANGVDARVEARLVDGTVEQADVSAVMGTRVLRIAVTYQSALPGRWLEVTWKSAAEDGGAPPTGINVTSASVK